MSFFIWNSIVSDNTQTLAQTNGKGHSINAQFIAGVELGVPSRKCRNFGICRITPIEGLTASQWRSDKLQSCQAPFKGIVTVLDDQSVEIDFMKESISEENVDKYFSGTHFLMEEAFHFTYETDSDYNFSIAKGKYPIYRTGQLIKVAFH
ncbi:MAG: hypothetical protein AAFV95_12625 [Bacteroidota bacterium]